MDALGIKMTLEGESSAEVKRLEDALSEFSINIATRNINRGRARFHIQGHVEVDVNWGAGLYFPEKSSVYLTSVEQVNTADMKKITRATLFKKNVGEPDSKLVINFYG